MSQTAAVRIKYSSTSEAMKVFSTSVGHVTGPWAKKRRRWCR